MSPRPRVADDEWKGDLPFEHLADRRADARGLHASATVAGGQARGAPLRRVDSDRSVGMSVCCSIERSTTPATCAISRLHLRAERRSICRSSPKIFTAMFARVPESMWSMRCEIGWPIVTFMPGSSDTFCRMLVEHLVLRPVLHLEPHVDLGRLDTLHVLVELRPAGAPGRRRDLRTSAASAPALAPSASDSARLVPGRVTALTVSAPSLNSGRNDRPSRERSRRRPATSSGDGSRRSPCASA